MDVAELAIKVAYDSADKAKKSLDGLTTSAGKTEKATDSLGAQFTKLIAPLAATVSAVSALNKIVEVQRQFDILNAGLITATGSSEKAAVAFTALQQFAQKTPYDLAQAVDGFTKLVNLGLTPSEKALNSYGNTASALGKNLNQMIEAVADAATGEFERLKEFGIKAKNQGDTIQFTFQGVATTVKNNASEIENYLIALGDNQFAGAMQKRMDTLDGAISNLGDTWDSTFRLISQSGVGGVIEDAVKLATDALQELNDMLASGELQGYLSAIGGQFKTWGDDVKATTQIVGDFLSQEFEDWGQDGKDTVDVLIDAFRNFPSNVKAFVQLMTVEVAAALDKTLAYAVAFKDEAKAIFTDDTFADVQKRFDDTIKAADQARDDSIASIVNERDASVKASDDKIAASKKLREEYDKQQAAAAKNTDDRLAGFKVGGGKPAASAGSTKADAAAQKKRDNEYKSLQESLRSEEESIQASYDKRTRIIEENTKAGSAIRAEEMERSDVLRADQLQKLKDTQQKELQEVSDSLRTQEQVIQDSYTKRMAIVEKSTKDGSAARAALAEELDVERSKALADLDAQHQQEKDSLYASLLTQEESLRQSYDRKKQLILDSTVTTETERQDLLRRLDQQFADEQAKAEADRMTQQLGAASQLFDGLAGIAKNYAGEQSKAYKALFAISKAFSIAQAAVSISTGLAKAQELGFPANLAEMARVGAAGASIVAQISGAQFSGAYDKGGQIPAGKIGIVGEHGPEFVRGPAAITGREMTKRQQGDAQGNPMQLAPPVVNVRNINVLDPSIVADYLGSDEGEQLIVNTVQRNRNNLGN